MGITKLAREIRRKETEAEKLLWEVLRKRKVNGLKFVRQHPIYYKNVFETTYFFIADFYCAECNLVIELDGGIHELNKEYDAQRDAIIREKGTNVLRIKNTELQDLKRVLDKIKDKLTIE